MVGLSCGDPAWFPRWVAGPGGAHESLPELSCILMLELWIALG